MLKIHHNLHIDVVMLFKIFKTAKIENRTKKFFYMYADFQNIFSFFQYHKGEVTVGKKLYFF